MEYIRAKPGREVIYREREKKREVAIHTKLSKFIHQSTTLRNRTNPDRDHVQKKNCHSHTQQIIEK